MITKNYYNLLASMAIVQGNAPLKMSARKTSGEYYQPYNLGNNRTLPIFFMPSAVSGSATSIPNSNNSFVVFGTSDAEETFDDYTINAVNLSNTIGTYYAPTYNSDNNEYIITRRFVITNNTAESVTINEFGFMIAYHTGASSGHAATLIYRKKLESGFTVDVGETVNFDLSVSYSMPNGYTPYE